MNLRPMKSVTIIIPTLNEAENIDELFKRISGVRKLAAYNVEVLFVDDASTDATKEKIEGNKSGLDVRLLQRPDKRGLASAVIDGAAAAKGEIIVIMDADLSHPPEIIPDLIESVVTDGCD